MIISDLKIFIASAALAFFSFETSAAPFAVFNHKIFYVAGEGPVVETYLEFDATSMVMKDYNQGLLKANVEATIIFKQGENIVKFGKKQIESPEMASGNLVDFLDVQRFIIQPGKYIIEITLKDLNATENDKSTLELDFEVPIPKGEIFFSDIQLVSAFKKTDTPNQFSKAGYDLLPMVSDDILNPEMQELVLYCELYGTNSLGVDEMFLLTAHIAPRSGKTDIVESTRKLERRKAGEAVPFLSRISIAELKAGEYNIVLEARNKQNELLASAIHPVHRMAAISALTELETSPEIIAASWVNRYNNKRELYEHIRSLRPISQDKEIFTAENTMINIDEVELSAYQQYFYTFWESRDRNDSEGAWIVYREKVEFVKQKFATRNKKGYETDRGRVYLRYGPPVDIVDRANEPNSYPYQIWRYYKADKWNNVRFVFFDPRLTRADYDLLHCDFIPGELSTPQWRILLQQRTTPVIGPDDREGSQHFGGRVDDFYENPR